MGFAGLFIVDIINVINDLFELEVLTIHAGKLRFQLDVFLFQDVHNAFQ
jgi:hypothetical protein